MLKNGRFLNYFKINITEYTLDYMVKPLACDNMDHFGIVWRQLELWQLKIELLYSTVAVINQFFKQNSRKISQKTQIFLFFFQNSSEFISGGSLTRGISLNVLRVERILEGTVGIQYYKNSVNPGPVGHTFTV